MGLRCLIGHEYGEPETEREREERGDEVVVTEREYKECGRCGQRRVISENTEVKAAASGSASDREPGTGGRTGADVGSAGEEYGDVTAAEDDGVILEEGEAETAEDAPREWPEREGEPDEAAVEHDPWPEAGGEDEGYDAEPAEGPAEDVEFGGGLAPESDGDAEPDADAETVEPVPEDDGGDADTGFARAAPGPDPGDPQRPAEADTEFVCPECGHTAPAVGGSLRSGDICPECGQGYLAEREPAE
ncbi:MAG: oxidoreductase [Halobacteriales archaeon]